MNVLKINENITSIPTSTEKRLSAGIDLGTTNSLIATVYNGHVYTLTDPQGRHLLPSVVYYQKDRCIVGYKDSSSSQEDIFHKPCDVIFSIKRIIGRSIKDIQRLYPYLPYNLQPDKNGLPIIKTCAGFLNPVQISADILKALSKRASKILKKRLNDVVITVPAYFNDAQRRGTKDAADLAGLNVLRLLNEPTAAAIAYGLDSKKEGIIAVYDLGGGTFDISILQINDGIFEVLSTGGDSALGGDDFDNLLAKYICELAGIGNLNDDLLMRKKLLNIAVSSKIALSDVTSVVIEIAGWKGEISRVQFNSLITPLIKHSLLICHRSLKDAGLRVEEICEVIMVGGSTRIPLVRDQVNSFFGRISLTAIDPDRAVAIGAAIQADVLVGNKTAKNMLLLDVIPISLGIETIGGLTEKIILRNTTIPTVKSKVFTTFKDGQTSMSIHVIQGEHELVKNCQSLSRFVLRGIPPLPAGGAHVIITFKIDADGLLSVTALEKSSGKEAVIRIKPSYDLVNDKTEKVLRSLQ